MKVYINGQSVKGNPEDLAQLLGILGEYKEEPELPTDDPQPKEVETLQNTLTESQKLRQQLEADPDFNPYPGVINGQSEDMTAGTPLPESPFLAEKDTGVQHES